VRIVSALVCTRNRSKVIPNVVRSLLDESDRNVELLIIDQSDDAETERALEPWSTDARLRYYRSKTRGKGAALNEGIQLARGEIVVCTDDDCEVPPGWVEQMARAVESQPSAAIVFCRVVAAPHDQRTGYIPSYEFEGNRMLRSVLAGCRGLGLGAAMAIRRDFVLAAGGFDESLGPGARFRGGEDWDISLRALVMGRAIYETSELSVLHDGFRTFAEGRTHARRDWIAIGALCAKPLRAGYIKAAIVPAWYFASRAVWPPVADLLHLRKPSGLVRITAFVEGFAKALRVPVNPLTLRFNVEPGERSE